jgi:hypothetical protein
MVNFGFSKNLEFGVRIPSEPQKIKLCQNQIVMNVSTEEMFPGQHIQDVMF